MNRAEVTEKILSAKRMKELSWEEIAKKIGGASKIIVTAACLGQMKMTKEQSSKAAKLFGLGKEETLLLQEAAAADSIHPLPSSSALRSLAGPFYQRRPTYRGGHPTTHKL